MLKNLVLGSLCEPITHNSIELAIQDIQEGKVGIVDNDEEGSIARLPELLLLAKNRLIS